MLALVFSLTGGAKLMLPRDQLAKRMHAVSAWPAPRIRLLGAAELAGAVGLCVPQATGIAPLLTPLAALCLGLLMVGAVQAHRRLGEGSAPALISGALCVVVAAGRLIPGV